MKCKNCKTVLEEGQSVCPSCGQEVKKSRLRKLPTWAKVALATAAALALLVGSVGIWWMASDVESFREGWAMTCALFDPPENDVFYKTTYSASDKKAMKWNEKVVASVGTEKLTNGQLQIYYWMNVYDFFNNYGYYAVYQGLDYTQPLDQQNYGDFGGTWQQYFLSEALTGWHKYQAMALMAREEGMTLSEEMQEDLDGLRATLTQTAVQSGFSSIDAMLQSDMGGGCTYEDYAKYMEVYYYGYLYFEKMYDQAQSRIDDRALEEYFQEHEEDLKDSGITKDAGLVYGVRHILIVPEGGTEDDEGNVTWTEEEWEACRVEAQAILDEWLAGEATEETFAQLANEHSADTGSNQNGGLYEDLDEDTSFVEEYVDWYTAEGRKVGDYGLIKSEHGYHIMYLSDMEDKWIAACRDGILSEEANQIAQTAMENYPMDVTYKNIALAVVDLSSS